MYLTAMAISTPGNNCTCSFQSPNLRQWDAITAWNRHIAVISKSDIRLPPGAQVQPLCIEATFAPPFSDSFEIRGTVGAGSTEPFPFDFDASSQSVQAAYDEYHQKVRYGLTEDDKHSFSSRLMGLKSSKQTNDIVNCRQGE